jgi:FKBP-type peptidyl-prolyl cis-trans isomerase 2
VHAEGSGKNETARAKNKLATDLDKEEVAGRPEEQKVSLLDGRVSMVIVKYIGAKCVIFDGNDQFVEEKLYFKIELVEIL